MPKYRVIMTRKAKSDLIDIGDYISYTLLEPETAYNFIKALRKAIESLRELPERYALVDDEILSRQGIYCMPFKNYYVFYQVIEDSRMVIVLRVGYNRRNWKEILRK